MSIIDDVGLGRAFRLGKDVIIFERWGRDETYVRVFGGDDGLIRDELVRRWNAEEDRRKRT